MTCPVGPCASPQARQLEQPPALRARAPLCLAIAFAAPCPTRQCGCSTQEAQATASTGKRASRARGARLLRLHHRHCRTNTTEIKRVEPSSTAACKPLQARPAPRACAHMQAAEAGPAQGPRGPRLVKMSMGEGKIPPGISRLAADQTLELSPVEATHVRAGACSPNGPRAACLRAAAADAAQQATVAPVPAAGQPNGPHARACLCRGRGKRA